MKKIRLIAFITGLILVLSSFTVFGATPELGDVAVISQKGITYGINGLVEGNTMVKSGKVSSAGYGGTNGTTYVSDKVTTSIPSYNHINTIKRIDSSYFKDYSISHNVAKYPTTKYFKHKKVQYRDGTKSLTVGWSGYNKPSGYTIDEDGYYKSIEVEEMLTLNIKADKGEVRVIRTGNLKNRGHINIVGEGSVVIYADKISFDNSIPSAIFSEKYNMDGATEKFALVTGDQSDLLIMSNAKFNGILVSTEDKVIMTGSSSFKGNMYLTGSLTTGGFFTDKGYVYAPNSDTQIMNGTYLEGVIVSKSMSITGGSKILHGDVFTIEENLNKQLGNLNKYNDVKNPSGEVDTSEESVDDSSEVSIEDSKDESSQEESTSDDTNEVEITAVVPDAIKMSIRLEDGRILRDGDKFKMPVGGTVKYQVCTNNWDSKKYSDGGEGLQGTVVYEYTYEKGHEKYLRVDNMAHFKPVIFSFKKGDYLKQTGVEHVIAEPLESLSMNFPLGTSINVKAYVDYKQVDTANIFVEQGNPDDVYRYYWNY